MWQRIKDVFKEYELDEHYERLQYELSELVEAQEECVRTVVNTIHDRRTHQGDTVRVFERRRR